MKKFRTLTMAVALTTALSFGAVGAYANTSTPTMNTHTGTSGTMGTGTTTTSGYTGSNYDATTGTSAGTGLMNGAGTIDGRTSGTGTITPIGTATPSGTTTPTTYGTHGNTYTGKSTDGTGVMGQINGYGNNMMDRMSTKGTTALTNVHRGNYDTSSYRAYATTADNKRMDWGWLGLVGLIGLAGLRGNNNNRRREDFK